MTVRGGEWPKCVISVKFGGKIYAPGSSIKALPEKQLPLLSAGWFGSRSLWHVSLRAVNRYKLWDHLAPKNNTQDKLHVWLLSLNRAIDTFSLQLNNYMETICNEMDDWLTGKLLQLFLNRQSCMRLLQPQVPFTGTSMYLTLSL